MPQNSLGLADSWGKITSLRFNQDQSCFIASFSPDSEDRRDGASSSTDFESGGIRIFHVDPIRELAHLTSTQLIGGSGHAVKAEMLFRTNLLALVAAAPKSGGSSKMAENVVLIYDMDTEKMRMEFTLPTTVLAVRLKRDKLIAVCKNQITVFSFPHNPKKLYTLTTQDNPRGLCEVSPYRLSALSEARAEFMAFPGYKRGSLQIVDLSTTEEKVSSAPVVLSAHKSDLWCIAVNQNGTMIATASSKGTLIRIWDAGRRIMLVELRRGSDPASLHCINFSPDDEWLCASSDKGTVHIFALQDYRLNKRSALASIGVPGAYAGSQWSLASFTVPQEIACICAFGRSEQQQQQSRQQASSSSSSSPVMTIYAVCLDGSFHKYHFTANGQCNQVAYDVFTELCEDCVWEDMRK